MPNGKHLCKLGANGQPCNKVRIGEPYDVKQDCRPCWLFHHVKAYNLDWGGDGNIAISPRVLRKPQKPLAPIPQPGSSPTIPGPGTELTKLLESLGISASLNCGCKAKARQMDEWGIEGCKAHRNEIAGWLADNASKRGWPDKLKAGALAVKTGIALQLNPADLYGSLVDLAIQRAEAALLP